MHQATFQEIYKRLLKAALAGGRAEEAERLKQKMGDELDCLLNPQAHPVVWKLEACACTPDEQKACAGKCGFEAMLPNQEGGIRIDGEKCVGCCECIDRCKQEKLAASKDILPVLAALEKKTGPAYALVAPAFLGQFSEEVTPGKLRSALKRMGFDGMIEVALFADILTLKEALEFDKNIVEESDYQLTSCCCPMWIAMIRRIYNELMPHVPGAVSPMIACGRTVKTLDPNALTVFIGPCMAKKAEAREKDIAGAVDYVLTFEEIQDVFSALEIDPAEMEESEKDHSSRAGRIYARAGGVSEAVKQTVNRLNPGRKITVCTQQADGVPACKAMINELLAGKTTANFFEGMGCVGGCVGGPKVMIDRMQGKKNVDRYGEKAVYPTPIDNPYVIELLHRLDLDTVDSLILHSDIFTRTF